jgi:hypothetical protein
MSEETMYDGGLLSIAQKLTHDRSNTCESQRRLSTRWKSSNKTNNPPVEVVAERGVRLVVGATEDEVVAGEAEDGGEDEQDHKLPSHTYSK